jgi:Leucine Rich repeat
MPEQHSPKSWRYRLRLSMRALIVLILLISCGFGWIVHGAKVQRDSVAAIERVGGQVMYDWEWKNGEFIGNEEPWAPNWLVDRIGVDYFGHVVRVSIDVFDVYMMNLDEKRRFDAALVPPYERRIDVALVQVGRLRRLEELDLNGLEVTDAGLAHLGGLTSLHTLVLRSTKVTDAGVKELQRALPNLRIVR